MITAVRKRDGTLEDFDRNRILVAITKAFMAVGKDSQRDPRNLTDEVVSTLEVRVGRKVPSVEEIQDIVEEILIKNDFADIAKAYILYRRKHADIREYKKFIGVKDDLKLGINALTVMHRRYLLRDSKGNVIETPSGLFRRVAHHIASADRRYDSKTEVRQTEERFFKIMADRKFLPNSPTLMNAGTQLGQLSACFVIPIEDSLSSIFDAVKTTAMIHKSGGGTGYSFSKLRPRGDNVKTSGGIASGPVSFMKIFDATTEEIKQGGRRRGANMGVLSVYHPDIIEFVTAKSRGDVLRNFNISVSVDDQFMKAALAGQKRINLVNPRNGEATSKIVASELLQMIVSKAWETGDPGLVFIDTINRGNPTPAVGKIEATNPCGEQPLLPNESCNLGSVNLSEVVMKGRIDWKELENLVNDGVHFLDNVVELNRYPVAKIGNTTRANRKIGLGIMGFAEALIKLGIRYDSQEAIEEAHKVMSFIQKTSHRASQRLAEKRGSFPNIAKSIWPGLGYNQMRNATTTTIAPTGTISIIAGCSSGIEPLFAICFVRDVMEGTKLLEANPLFEETARNRGFYSQELMMKIAETGTVKNLAEVPSDVRQLFVTALDISPEWHVKVQAAFQKYTDNAVSKTINMSKQASIEDVRNTYVLAWKMKCKGITVYRYGSKSEQVLYLGSSKDGSSRHVVADSEYSGGCIGSVCPT
ncbi:MAG: adenosylcobalamin-dependent ribonucleoside-diphosphate reductase [Nitrososphaerota archaeon]|nr:adenosylcobalamin-dependent ribonucleoside-diphosphate reductase [Nitrososphaerota archaeon]